MHIYFSRYSLSWTSWSWVILFHAIFLNLASADIRALLTDENNHWAANTTVRFPEAQGFDSVTERWTVFRPPTYVAAISPGDEADVVQVVKLARENNISFLATGGRHGFVTTLGDLQNGLSIDLSQLNHVSVDPIQGALTVGGGTRVRGFLDAVYNAGYEIPIGSCSCPGYVGIAIGAGIGRWQGLYGLVTDALLSVRLVTADGWVVEASEDINSDLFWGIRGAGANFGIITSATFKLSRPVQNGTITNFDFLIPAEMSRDYFNVLASYNGSMPSKLSSLSSIEYNDTVGAPQVMANWVYMGSLAEGREALAPVLALQPPTAEVTTVAWNKLIHVAGFGMDRSLCENGLARRMYTANVRNLSAPTYAAAFDEMTTFYENYPAARSSGITFEVFPNQAMVSIPSNSTAYPWRDALGNIIIQFIWSGQADTDGEEMTESLGRRLRDDFVATSGYPDLSVYVNYAYGDETLEQIYGRENLPRLSALKNTWDPDNMFAYNIALPTEYP